MAEGFRDRLREATVDPGLLDEDALQKSAAAASSGLSPERGIAILRAAHGRLKAGNAADLRAKFNNGAELLGEQDDQLLGVLATEALIVLFTRINGGLGLIPALGVRCARHASWRSLHPDLGRYADSYLRQRAVFLRRRTPPGTQIGKEAKSEEQIPRLEEELGALREVLEADRALNWERDQLSWFLLSATRPAGLLTLAQELDRCLMVLPEPTSTDQILAAKLAKPVGDAAEEAAPSPAAEIADLCPDLGRAPAGDREADEAEQMAAGLAKARRYLDQIQLNRAFVAAKR